MIVESKTKDLYKLYKGCPEQSIRTSLEYQSEDEVERLKTFCGVKTTDELITKLSKTKQDD